MLQIEQHISECYETRYNELLHIMEYRRRVSETEQPDPFRILDDRMENSIWMEMNELGYACNVKMIQNLIYSDFSSSYHPIREYFKELPEWDGTDYIRILADSVRTNHQSFWTGVPGALSGRDVCCRHPRRCRQPHRAFAMQRGAEYRQDNLYQQPASARTAHLSFYRPYQSEQ